jgi:hypothetical protein
VVRVFASASVVLRSKSGDAALLLDIPGFKPYGLAKVTLLLRSWEALQTISKSSIRICPSLIYDTVIVYLSIFMHFLFPSVTLIRISA